MHTNMDSESEQSWIVKDVSIHDGEPIIRGTRTPVCTIVASWRLGIPPDELTERHSDLTIEQVYAALGYYHRHRNEINEHIRRHRRARDKGTMRARYLQEETG
jgi:uncharacterized protein (DUF433 family)